MRISAVIVTKNEEHNIRRCIESVNDVVDEIVVVDSGSTDATEAIVKEFSKARFIQTEWVGFSRTKNYANSLAQGDYILSLDADEALSLELKKSIVNIKHLTGAYSFNRLTNYCGYWVKHCGWYPDTKLRLFEKGSAYWNNKEVHEDIEVVDGTSVQRLSGNLYHYSYYNFSEHMERVNRYSDLAAHRIVKSHKSHLRGKAIVRAHIRFIKSYVFQLGFLDGYWGLHICLMSALEVYLKYSKASLLLKKTR